MTVKQLIDILKKQDPTQDVHVRNPAGEMDLVVSIAIKPLILGESGPFQRRAFIVIDTIYADQLPKEYTLLGETKF